MGFNADFKIPSSKLNTAVAQRHKTFHDVYERIIIFIVMNTNHMLSGL